ncbi:MAG: hypothetical protein Q7S95_03805 [bacterium]|nr:hypothetical protein [bacterium]
MRLQLSHASAVIVVYRAINPQQVFMDRKDNTHPRLYCRLGYCPIGGNRNKGRAEAGPRELALAEMREELTFLRAVRDDAEYKELGTTDTVSQYAATTISGATITAEDEAALEAVKTAVERATRPYGDFIARIPNRTIQHFEPNWDMTRPEISYLCSYFEAGLDEQGWGALARLQKKFGNLSNESQTEIFILDQMDVHGEHGAFQHGPSMQYWWASHGYQEQARRLKMLPGITAKCIGPCMNTWARYDAVCEFKNLA